MPFKPNYRFERIERERKKQARKDEKLRRQQERAPAAQDNISPAPPEENNLTET